MTVLQLVVFFIVSCSINVIITSFIIAHSYHSKKLMVEFEDMVMELIKKVDMATNEQLVLAEDTVRKLKKEIKLGKEVYKKFSLLDLDKYHTLLAILQKIQKQKNTAKKIQQNTTALQDTVLSHVSTNDNHRDKNIQNNFTIDTDNTRDATDTNFISQDEIDLMKI